MTLQPQNRMADTEKRGRGRPPKEAERPPAVEAETVVIPDRVLPCMCPKCGRGQQPRTVRRRPNGIRDCSCALCGKEFEYIPAMVRSK